MAPVWFVPDGDDARELTLAVGSCLAIEHEPDGCDRCGAPAQPMELRPVGPRWLCTSCTAWRQRVA